MGGCAQLDAAMRQCLKEAELVRQEQQREQRQLEARVEQRHAQQQQQQEQQQLAA